MPMRGRKRPPRTSRVVSHPVFCRFHRSPFRRSQELNDLQIVQALQDLGCTFDYFSRASLAMGEWLQFTVECEAKTWGMMASTVAYFAGRNVMLLTNVYDSMIVIAWPWEWFVNVTYGDICGYITLLDCLALILSAFASHYRSGVVHLPGFQVLQRWGVAGCCRGCGCGGIWWDKVGCKTCGIQGWQMSNDGNLPTQLAVHGSRWRWSRSSKHFNVCFFSKLIAGARDTGKVTQLSKGLCYQKVSYFCW